MEPTRFLLDTDIVSDLARHAPALKNRLISTPYRALGVSTITVMEIYYGLYRNPIRAHRVFRDLDNLFSSIKIIDFTTMAADETGRIRTHLENVGRPIGPYDLMIAGTALAHNLTLVSGNIREFSRVPGLRVENWRIPVNEVREERVPYGGVHRRIERLDAAVGSNRQNFRLPYQACASSAQTSST